MYSQRTYGASPEILIEGDETITCSYIPTHLEYILFENLKNAMRAVVERHSSRQRWHPPKLNTYEAQAHGRATPTRNA